MTTLIISITAGIWLQFVRSLIGTALFLHERRGALHSLMLALGLCRGRKICARIQVGKVWRTRLQL